MAEVKTIIGNVKYVLTEEDKNEIAQKVVESQKSEVWTFTLEDGTEVTKEVVLK